MKFYISFGQIHTHSISGFTIDKDCIVVFEADSKAIAHKRAMDIFDKKFHNVYEKKPDMTFFPRGLINIYN